MVLINMVFFSGTAKDTENNGGKQIYVGISTKTQSASLALA
jgi:hypothetical protein